MSYYRQQLEEWLGTRKVFTDTVYDIGGAQGDVRPRLENYKIASYRVLDLPHYDVEKLWGDVGQADVVFCLEVFEYLINPVTAMLNIKNCLKPGGAAYVTFAFSYPHHNELEQDSLRYTEFGIYRLAKLAELNVTDMWYRLDKSGLLRQFYAADGMKAAKQYPHHDVTGFIVELTK